ncbi:sugar transferase [Aeromonas jandaei]|uniref:sugar transferase n=2 Tax=Aeromonas jandaei TaxID=650 RepID=UPI00207B353F|nr:sugar transferase [Aeromonas jandaei]
MGLLHYQRRHSRWYERVFLSPVFIFCVGVIISVLIPAFYLWGWQGWLNIDGVRINSISGAFFAFLFSIILLSRFLRYPGARPVAYMIPSVTASFGLLVGILLFTRVDYSRQLIFESYVLTMLSGWAIYFLGRRYWRLKYALIPVGSYMVLNEIDTVEWRIIDRPNLGTVRYDAVVADLHSPELVGDWERFLAQCALSHIPVYHSKQVYESLTGRVKLDHLHENNLGSLLPSPLYSFLKRWLDLIITLIVFPLLLPIMLITALFIKIESHGPVFFLQNRVGKGNKDFCIYKFRSMYIDAEITGAQFAQAGDSRVTRVGKVIRKLRIDELPQFINVLKGDMSLIGPRPEQRTFVNQFEREIPFYMYRHIVRPGISGWAQVVHGYAADADDTKIKIEHDFFYIKNFSLWLDVLIIFKTIKTILTGFGAR